MDADSGRFPTKPGGSYSGGDGRSRQADPGTYLLRSGEHEGQTLADVYATDPRRVRWYAKQDGRLGEAARQFLKDQPVDYDRLAALGKRSKELYAEVRWQQAHPHGRLCCEHDCHRPPKKRYVPDAEGR